MATAIEMAKQMKLELAAKVEKRRLATALERENAKWGFNPQWRRAEQIEFVMTYTPEAQAREIEMLWAKIKADAAKGTVENQGIKNQSKTLNLSGSSKKSVGKVGRKVVCESELRRGGSVSVKRFSERVCHLNGHSETFAKGERFNGSLPGANAVLALKF